MMLLALLGREVPEMPCELMFSRWECSLLEKRQPLVAPETMTGIKTVPRSRHLYYQSAGRGSE